VCILVNCAVERQAGVRADPLSSEFLAGLDTFVRKQGKGLIILSGDNVQPDAYNRVLDKKLGLLPMPIKGVVKADKVEPYFLNRSTFGVGPPAYRIFKEDDYYVSFDLVGVWQHLDLDETLAKVPEKEKQNDAKEKDDDAARADDNQ